MKGERERGREGEKAKSTLTQHVIMKGKQEEAEMLFSMLNIQTGRGIQKGREVCDLFWTCVYVCVPGLML